MVIFTILALLLALYRLYRAIAGLRTNNSAEIKQQGRAHFPYATFTLYFVCTAVLVSRFRLHAVSERSKRVRPSTVVPTTGPPEAPTIRELLAFDSDL